LRGCRGREQRRSCQKTSVSTEPLHRIHITHGDIASKTLAPPFFPRRAAGSPGVPDKDKPTATHGSAETWKRGRVRNAAPSSGDGQPTSGSTGYGAQRNARATVSAAPIRVCTHDGLPVKSACAAFVRHADVVRRLALRPGPRTTMRTAR
jgi:hypothetical protein